MRYATHPRQRFHFPAARVCFQNELKEAKEAGDRDKECGAYTNLGIAYKSLDDFIKAAKCHHQQVLSISKENGNKDFQKAAYVNLGKFYYSLNDFGLKAIDFHQQLRLFVSQKRLKTNIQKETHVVPLAMRISVILKEQSNFIGRLSV